jgi:hypothetical protein
MKNFFQGGYEDEDEDEAPRRDPLGPVPTIMSV